MTAIESVNNVKENVKSNVKTVEKQLKNEVDKQAKKLDKKRHVVDGKVTQVKGFAQEKIGELTNNDRMRRAGQRKQVVGKLQERGLTMPRTKTLFVLGTAVALAVAFVFLRGDSES